MEKSRLALIAAPRGAKGFGQGRRVVNKGDRHFVNFRFRHTGFVC